MNAALLIVLSFIFFSSVQAEGFCNINPNVVPKYNISICTMVHNEARYIEEWISYHLLLGVDHFYIYNDRSSDPLVQVLQPYIKRGVVTLIPWNHTAQTVEGWLVERNPTYTRPQRFAIGDCLMNHQDESNFFGVWDIDEFPVLSDFYSNLNDFVYTMMKGDDYEIPVTVYGSSGFENTPKGLVIDNFRMRSRLTAFGFNSKDNRFSGKSMYRSGCGRPNVHFTHELLKPCNKIWKEWTEMEGSRIRAPLTMNHYGVKSWDHFVEKTKKWNFGLDKKLFDAQLISNNVWRDEVLVKFVEPVKQLMECMKSG